MLTNIPFFIKSAAEIRIELAGFPPDSVEAALRFREEENFAHLEAFLVGALAIYLPKGCACPRSPLPPETLLREDLGLDSLSLVEMAFKLDELLGIPFETREIAQIQTLGQLNAFLRTKMEGCPQSSNS